MNYSQIISELESRGVMPDRAPSLLPTTEAIEELKLQYDPHRVILVAGTNGKGTTAAALESLLLSAGQSVGLYTSPHLESTCERIRVNKKEISQSDFLEVFSEINSSLKHDKLTHFEMLTIMALKTFIDEKVDWMIFEVGLGGTWDATNAVKHATSVIAKIGYDHEHILGKTLWEILQNKLGIVKKSESGSQHLIVHQPFPVEVQKQVESFKASVGGRWIERVPFDYSTKPNGLDPKFFIHTKWGDQENSMVGKRGAENIALALTVFSSLGFIPENHLQSIKNVNWPGRMESILVKGKRVFLSGDHNPQGIESLLEILPNYKFERLFILAGVGKNKDLENILAPLFKLTDCEVYLTETPFQGFKVSEYGNWLAAAKEYRADPYSLLELICERASAKDLILVTGSIYLCGDIKKKYRKVI